ncbi:hypothetical protein D3C78_1517610 [compost metagenome]
MPSTTFCRFISASRTAWEKSDAGYSSLTPSLRPNETLASEPVMLASNTFMGGSPTKVPVKRFAGRSLIFCGVSNCCSTPPSMTAMRSARALASV